MCIKKPFRCFAYVVLCLLVTISIAACTPAIPQGPQAITDPSTTTPEVFNPLDPSPTLSDSTLPQPCQVTDLNVYVNRDWGYCFAYPMNFTQDKSKTAEGMVAVYGPALDNNADPLRVSLEVTVQVVPEGSTLAPLVDAYLASFENRSSTIMREQAKLGSEPAENLEPVPGLLNSRMVVALHEDVLFILRFHPSDLMIAKPHLNAVMQTVTGSFAFLPRTSQPALHLQKVSWSEFGQNISLSYNSILAPWVDVQTVPAVPVSDQILFAESQPTYAQIRFWGFQGGRLYDLPLLPLENRVAQVRIFHTADFPGFGDDNPQGFVNQSQALKGLLERGVEPERCAQPVTGEPALPFLPWINMKQSFCAQPEIIAFPGGKGIRYLSYYAQGPSPVLDQQVFYTFQGLTEDEQFYVAAFFPVQTSIFPTEPPACPRCGEPNYDPLAEWTTMLSQQLTQLNAQPEDDFVPSLTVLDELIESIRVGK